MKLLPYVLALSIFATATTALADICKLKQNKEGIYESKYARVGMNFSEGLAFHFLISDDTYFLEAVFAAVFKYSQIVVDQETPLKLHLVNGQELIVYPVDENTAKKKIAGFAWNRKKMKPVYSLARDDLILLASENLTLITVKAKYDGEQKDTAFEVKEKWAKRLKTIAKCIVPENGSPVD